MKRLNKPGSAGVVALVVCLLGFSMAHAKKPDNPGGGGGGGGDGSTSTRFSVVEIPVDGDPVAISEPGPGSRVTVSIDSHEAGYVSAAFATVDGTGGNVIASGFLPEPPFVDPNDGAMKNGWSSPGDVNVFGQIVGSAATYDPEATGDPSPSRALLWVDDGSGYAYTLLPMLPGATASNAFGTNNWGDIVGRFVQAEGSSVAVIWAAETLEAFDLNTEATAALGWQLRVAYDINDAGLVVGHGLLNGVFRGYVLDLPTGSIWPVPLVGPATGNVASRINEAGRIIGDAWDGDGSPWNPNPDYYQAYSWDGPGTDPEVLPSLTLNTSIAGGLNDLGATVGNAVIPSDDLRVNDLVSTLWEYDVDGNVPATDLQTEISSTYSLVRSHDVNNDGWIAAYGRKRYKGRHQYRALLLLPTSN